MGEMLSQAEIDALLNSGPSSSSDPDGSSDSENNNDSKSSSSYRDIKTLLSPQEIDSLTKISNTNMDSSAATLVTLLGQNVSITTLAIDLISKDQVTTEYESGFVAIKVEYTQGLKGSYLLILKENDVKVITDLMMGGEGLNTSEELTDLHISAIGEALNQMSGSAATSMSTMFGKRIDILPPKAFRLNYDSSDLQDVLTGSDEIIKVSFKMVIGELVDSEIMQMIPVSFAKELVHNLINGEKKSQAAKSPETNNTNTQSNQVQQQQQMPGMNQQPMGQMFDSTQQPMYQQPMQQGMYPQGGYPYGSQPNMQGQQSMGSMGQEPRKQGINVQPIQFQAFEDSRLSIEKKNISIIMDIPLLVTVELGRTNRLIREILEYGPGSIIELDKLAEEPVDILVNGKAIAKGEVVVIDDSFGVRITDIIHPSKRL